MDVCEEEVVDADATLAVFGQVGEDGADLKRFKGLREGTKGGWAARFKEGRDDDATRRQLVALLRLLRWDIEKRRGRESMPIWG